MAMKDLGAAQRAKARALMPEVAKIVRPTQPAMGPRAVVTAPGTMRNFKNGGAVKMAAGGSGPGSGGRNHGRDGGMRDSVGKGAGGMGGGPKGPNRDTGRDGGTRASAGTGNGGYSQSGGRGVGKVRGELGGNFSPIDKAAAFNSLSREDQAALARAMNSRAGIPSGYKNGGAVHSDVKQDKAMIRGMVKPSALKKADGGAARAHAKPGTSTGTKVERMAGGGAAARANATGSRPAAGTTVGRMKNGGSCKNSSKR